MACYSEASSGDLLRIASCTFGKTEPFLFIKSAYFRIKRQEDCLVVF